MDLLQGVRDAREEKEATSNGPNSDGAPSLEKLLSALEKLNISDENKDQLRQKLNSKANIDKVKAVMEDGPPVVPYELLVLMLLISVVAAIFDVDEKSADKSDNLVNKIREEVTDELLKKLETKMAGTTNYSLIFFLVCVLVIVVLFVFFGYTLYKSLIERERRKEEKKRQKQQKKKK